VTPAIFRWPAGAALLLVAPLAWAAWRVLDRARARRVAGVTGPRTAVLAAELDPARRGRARLLFAAGLLLAAIAAMQPFGGPGARTLEPGGADLVVCLDVSRSMLARDAVPSRLEAAKREIRALAAKARGDRLALVLFAGQTRLAAPLTHDVDAFADLVSLADPTSVPRGGTDIGGALAVALDALEGGTGDHQAIVLVTDGEDLGAEGLRTAEKARARRVVVHTAGFGSPEGSKVPVPEDHGEAFLRDRAGRDVVTAQDAAALRRIADATGGTYADATRAAGAIAGLYESEIRPKAREAFEARAGTQRENLFQWPLLAALACFAAAFAWNDRRRA
jgi:Ca-activated chloride channel family protein